MLHQVLHHCYSQQSELMNIKNISLPQCIEQLDKRQQLAGEYNNNNEDYDPYMQKQKQMHRVRKKLPCANEDASESSRAWIFCERCCGERQLKEQEQYAEKEQEQEREQEQEHQQQQPGIVAFYRSYMDSVSDLSSYRFVSDEEEANDNDVDANDDVSVGSLPLPCVEIEQHKSKTSTIAQHINESTTDKALNVEVPHASAFFVPHETRSVLPIIQYSNSNKVIQQQQKHLKHQQQQLLKVSEPDPTSFRNSYATIGHWPNDACRSSRHYNYRSHQRCGRRYPPPVPPKPKSRNRICFEVTACSGIYNAEPALKTRRLEHFQKQKLSQPRFVPFVLSDNHSSKRGTRSCADPKNIYSNANGWTSVNAENSCKFHAADNNRNNYNWKFDATSNKHLPFKKTCTLRYDHYGYLKEISHPNCNLKQKGIANPARDTDHSRTNSDEIFDYYNAANPLRPADGIDFFKSASSNEFDLSEPPEITNKVQIFHGDSSSIAVAKSIHSFDKKCSQSTLARTSVESPIYTGCCSLNCTTPQHKNTSLPLTDVPATQSLDNSLYACSSVGLNCDRDHTMDKRRNTLDRFQRLTFGRKAKPTASAEAASPETCRASSVDKQRNSSERSERLKELTELLRGGGNSSRASSTPTPPPVPPPRKPRIPHNSSTASSIEIQESQLPGGTEDSDPAMTGHLQKQSGTNNNKSESGSGSGNASVPATAARLLHSMRPNASLSNLEAFVLCTLEKSKSPPPLAVADEVDATSSEWPTQLSTAESRTGSSPSTQKGISAFRSVSFSQIDCKSTLSALRDRLRRDKAIEAPAPIERNTKIIESLDIPNVKPDPGWVHIPLKSTGLSINLNYGQEKSLEHVLEDVPDIISEEDIFNTDNCSATGILPATASSVIAAHAKMESLSDTIHSEGEYNVNKDCVTVVTEAPNIVEAALESTEVSAAVVNESEINESEANASQANSSEVIDTQISESQVNEPSLDNVDEPPKAESPSSNILQTATTCLIPVPVYECASQEWLETPAQEWVELAPEFGIVPETMQPPVPHAACKVMQTETLTTLPSNLLPTISVSRSSEEGDEQRKDIILSPAESISDRLSALDSVDDQRQQEDLDAELQSSDAIATPRHSTGERQKRHLDKSTKRKGMYIDNSDWHQPVVEPHRGLALDLSIVNFQAISPDSPDDSQADTNSPDMFVAKTPELEKGSPLWRRSSDRTQLLSSFSCQSSEEKDDAVSNSNSKNNSILHTDSMSDTEERISWSPTPSGDYESKRYSKRPLTVRGPYGQMMEAELKKPNRKQYDEILEEMRESDRLHPRREHSVADRKPSLGSMRSNMPQYSNSMRVRKSSAYLPVPTHARAASTPSQMEHANKPTSQSSKDLSETISMAEKQSQHQIKRAASEAPTTKTHHSKRNLSMTNESKSPHHHSHHHSKRSLDEGSSSGSKSKQSHAAGVPPTAALLAELLKGSSENMISEQRQKMIADTRTYVVQEIYRNEQSYVESLQTVVLKYLKVLKSPEHAGMIDTRTVDEIFFMVPDILEIHEKFLAELKHRLDDWDMQQKVGDAFIETFSKLEVLEVYTSFVNNCNRAKNAIRSMKHQRPSFSKFLETTAREHKGKLTLDNLLIKPVQKFPNYELLFQRLIKHTDHDHPDQKHLQDVLKLVHDILVHINCKEREIMENGQREATLRELEGVIEGITDLIAPDRQFLLFDLVSMPSGQGARKDRGFFLFNDLLVLTSIKKRSGTIRKPNSSICPGSVASTLDTNKYKFLTKISLDCLEIVKYENIKRIVSEIESLTEDCNKLQQISEITASIKYPHQYLEDVIRELHRDIQRQLAERQANDTQLNMLELTVSSPNGSQKLTVVFSKTERRANWEEVFNEAKLKLAATQERHPIPEFLTSIPIRKTRAGLQFTCAAATLSDKRDVWVCNSDGYVGQVCIMSLHPEPNVTSCNGVCNARILCVASVPAYTTSPNERLSAQEEKPPTSTQQNSYTQQLRDYRKSISPIGQAASALSVAEKKKAPTSNTDNGSDAAGGGSSDTQLDLNLSSSDDETDAVSTAALEQRMPSPAPSLHATYHGHQDSNPDESESNQSTMWIGTEDGCIHVYNSTDNIRIKKNRIKIEHHSAVFSILYLDNRVFVSLANGDICVYLRDGATSWNTCSSHRLSIGTVSSPVTKLLNVNGKLWCSIQGIIKVLDTESFSVINQIQISSDSKPITNMTVANNFVWISIQNSAHIKCFHSNTHQLITEVNLAPAVNKMLSNCDEIIRQHKAACLRVTSLLCCKDLIWIGTSAGVLLTIPAQGYEKGAHNIVPTGIPHGHTGHVRFLTFVESPTHGLEGCSQIISAATSRETGSGTSDDYTKQGSTKSSKVKSETKNILIISGGDGYEDFRNSGANSLSEIAGREDSTNHLLIWQI
ncbi:uncharacterized protein LOC6572289 isoform X2 [Drosophila mojavensis]|uniref:uncharacterized protein LOC6572289 isoform X2 n=1 Tax=Drosophila mojavensis TaxID=7230 RepID=UPI0013EE4E2D|nr:uncharacterized protein LOC6572289 isoform X2 [Drosophila mojavensis]